MPSLAIKNELIPVSSDFIGALFGAFDDYYRNEGAAFHSRFMSCDSWTSVEQQESINDNCRIGTKQLTSELRDTVYLIVGDLLQTLSVIVDCSKNSSTISTDLFNLIELINVTMNVPNTPHLR